MGVLAAIFVSLIIGIPAIILCVEEAGHELGIIMIIVTILCDLYVIILNCSIIKECVRQRIVVEKDIISGIYKKAYVEKKIEDVKKIVDYGEFYYISYYFPEKWVNCVCQKNLLVEGTIKEFEEFFEGKIVRKIKKTK